MPKKIVIFSAGTAQSIADNIKNKWKRMARAISRVLLLGCLVAASPACLAEEGSKPSAATAADKQVTGQTPSGQANTDRNPDEHKAASPKTSTEPPSDCAMKEDFKIRKNATSGPSVVYNGKLLPAGETVDFGIAAPLDPDAHYFAIFLEDNEVPSDNLDSRAIHVRQASETDELVVKHLLSARQTIVSVDIPSNVSIWEKRNLYIYQCEGSPSHVSFVPVYVSPFGWSIALTLIAGIVVYCVAARAFWVVSGRNLKGVQALNPIRFTAGADNRGSLSTLQVFFFSVLVFVMVAYMLMRTGVLSDLSTTILELLGISGLGATAAKGAESSKTAIDPVNQAWMQSKGWYNAPTVRPVSQPTFYDLISSDGNFDVYRYQSFMFSAAVGVALFIGGISQLASFTVPGNILGILGLSQVVYIAGKLVGPSTATQLNAVITDLRTAEANFRQAAHTNQPPGATATAGPPTTLQDAILRAGGPYRAYLVKATGAAAVFTQATGLVVTPQMMEPSF